MFFFAVKISNQFCAMKKNQELLPNHFKEKWWEGGLVMV